MQHIRHIAANLNETRETICKSIRKPPHKPVEPQWFCEVHPKPKTYIYYANGKLWRTRRAAIHYFAIRSFQGVGDPVLQDGLELRSKLLPLLLQAERKEVNKKLVDSLFTLPPTHVIRLGWRSIKTGLDHDILFLPVRFSYSGLSADRLAWECAIDLAERLSNTEFVPLLCPSQQSLRKAQMVWLSFLFFRFRGVTVDRNLGI